MYWQLLYTVLTTFLVMLAGFFESRFSGEQITVRNGIVLFASSIVIGSMIYGLDTVLKPIANKVDFKDVSGVYVSETTPPGECETEYVLTIIYYNEEERGLKISGTSYTKDHSGNFSFKGEYESVIAKMNNRQIFYLFKGKIDQTRWSDSLDYKILDITPDNHNSGFIDFSHDSFEFTRATGSYINGETCFGDKVQFVMRKLERVKLKHYNRSNHKQKIEWLKEGLEIMEGERYFDPAIDSVNEDTRSIELEDKSINQNKEKAMNKSHKEEKENSTLNLNNGDVVNEEKLNQMNPPINEEFEIVGEKK